MIALWAFAKTVPGRVWGYLAGALAILLLVGMIRQGGKDAARAEGRAKQLENVGNRNEVEREVGRLPDGAAAERLRDKWSRD